MPAPLIGVGVDEEQESLPARQQRLSRDEARKLLCSSSPSSPPSMQQSITKQRSESPRKSEFPHPTPSRARQLRSHDKIADRDLTESYFRLQLQQHISLHFASHAFTIWDVRSHADLSGLAERLVRLRLEHRAGSAASHKPRRTPSSSSEGEAEKVRRLYEWAIRKMMQDGFITVVESEQIERPPPSSRSAEANTERYCLVTPQYLLDPIRRIFASRRPTSPPDAGHDDVDEIAARLRHLDDRFRYVNRSIVQDTLTLYNSRYAPIVID